METLKTRKAQTVALDALSTISYSTISHNQKIKKVHDENRFKSTEPALQIH